MNFLKVKNQFFFQNFLASRMGCTTTMAAQGLGCWNFEEIQFLNRGVMCRNFQEASLITEDFPQDELFGSQKSKYFQNFFTSKSWCTATMAAQGLGAETLRKYSFWKEEQCVEIFRRLAWKLWISHKMDFSEVKNQFFSKIFSKFFLENGLYCQDGSTWSRWLKLWGNTVNE